MNAQQYRKAPEVLGLTQAEAAEWLGISVRSSNGFANGVPIPVVISKLLRLAVRLKLKPSDIK